ncbi:MAG: divalent metal cation transporter [Gemmatimonadetes bacterium]|nr:divalent metal cation transporter [Gemmatimonadota bacterium]
MTHPGHRRRGIASRIVERRAAGAGTLAAVLAVLGPGLLAGLSDDDPAGLTTYSLLGTDHGYRLLWVITLSVVLLVQFQLMAVRLGATSGKGFVALVRARWGVASGWCAAIALVVANFGTICAEYAGVAAAGELAGIPATVSVPIAGVLIASVVVLGSFHRVEHILLLLSATLALYLIDGVLAAPDWGAVAVGALVPRPPLTAAGWTAVAATIGTTLAPWGLAFIQSYAVDKRITVASLRIERWEVVVGAMLTGLIGLAVAVACAATLHARGVHIASAADAALALQPLAGRFATVLFGAGLLGAALLAAAIVPLATAYSVAEAAAVPASLDLDGRRFHWFYVVFLGLTLGAVLLVMVPGVPLIPLIVGSQVVNAVLLPLHLVALQLLAQDPRSAAAGVPPIATRAGWVSIAFVVTCLAAMAWGARP